jgi:BirA family biotin operon repressor/biotin-[acetyl-CoA-carboxylase] ligase
MKPDKIIALLKTRVLGRNIIYMEEADSTNAAAMRLVENGELTDGSLIVAGIQTAGKGRHGRSWVSDGGLCMTVAAKLENAGPVTLAAGIGVAEGLANVGNRQFFLKYPNDIISEKTGGKKVGGILAESKRGFIIIGIGINIEQDAFPPELEETAVSLKILGVTLEKEAACAAIINALEPWLEVIKAGNFHLITERWLKLNCTIGNKVAVRDVSPVVEGTATGLDGDGALIVETARGKVRVTTGGLITE